MSVCLLARRDADALAEAAAVDPTLPLAGEVLTVKACFDVAGWTTHAGSAVLADAPAADSDAPMVRRAAISGRHPAGADEHDRVRVRRAGAQQHVRNADDAVAPGRATRQRRLDIRWRRCGCARRRGHVARFRHQRIHTHPRGVLWCCRLQAVAGPVPVRWVDPAGDELRCAGSHRAHGRAPAPRRHGADRSRHPRELATLRSPNCGWSCRPTRSLPATPTLRCSSGSTDGSDALVAAGVEITETELPMLTRGEHGHPRGLRHRGRGIRLASRSDRHRVQPVRPSGRSAHPARRDGPRGRLRRGVAQGRGLPAQVRRSRSATPTRSSHRRCRSCRRGSRTSTRWRRTLPPTPRC